MTTAQRLISSFLKDDSPTHTEPLFLIQNNNATKHYSRIYTLRRPQEKHSLSLQQREKDAFTNLSGWM